MKNTYYSFLALFVALISIGYSIVAYQDYNIQCFYSQKLQMPLFTGFLTLGGFLLSLKTFILIKLKEGLYDNKYYVDLVRDKRAVNPDYSFYGPLTRLGKFLVFSVISALGTSFYQITFGWINHGLSAVIGLSLALTTSVMVLMSWWYIRCNLNSWFELLEKERVGKEKEETERALIESL